MAQQNNNDYQESNSIVLNLETLSTQYKNKLIEYQQAVANYVNYLREEASTPCGQFNANSKGIDQRCYNDIWSKVGCGAGTLGYPSASASWQQSQTMDGLIQDSFLWSTMTDYMHRMGCYGNPGNPYIIIGIGTYGSLWSRQGLDAPWEKISDNSSGVQGICTMNDGKGLLGTGGYNIYTKTSYTSNWSGPVQSACCVTSIAMAQDGTVVGVGTDNKLWSKSDLNSNWTPTATPGEWCLSVAIAPDGSIFVVGGGSQIWKKNSYQNLTSQQWIGQGSCCVKAITVAPDGTFIGVGTDDQLYTKANYQDLSTPWQGPYNSENSSCCVTGITTIANPNYNASNYNQTSAPNFNENQPPMSTVQSAAYWGTSAIGQNNSASLQECEASCASTNGCTGATYNPTAYKEPMCWLRGGDGDIVAGLYSDYAIVPKGKRLLSILQNINQELTSINQQIQNKTTTGQPLYDEQSQQRKLKTSELISQFIQLNQERERINRTLDEYQTLDQEQNQGNLMINQNYYSFILLLGLVILVLVILYKFGFPSTTQASPVLIQSGGELGTNAYYIVFGIVLVILIVNYIYKR